jgi:hypothetical protein
MLRFQTELFTQAYAPRETAAAGKCPSQDRGHPEREATHSMKTPAIPALGVPGHPRPTRARPLLPIYRAAQVACGCRVSGSCPRWSRRHEAAGEPREEGVRRGPVVCAGDQRRPRNAASAGSHVTQVRVEGGRRTESNRVGGCETDRLPTTSAWACMRGGHPPRRAFVEGRQGSAASLTRDSCRTLPPRASPTTSHSYHSKKLPSSSRRQEFFHVLQKSFRRARGVRIPQHRRALNI